MPMGSPELGFIGPARRPGRNHRQIDRFRFIFLCSSPINRNFSVVYPTQRTAEAQLLDEEIGFLECRVRGGPPGAEAARRMGPQRNAVLLPPPICRSGEPSPR